MKKIALPYLEDMLHSIEKIDLKQIWEVIQKDLPLLKKQLQEIVLKKD